VRKLASSVSFGFGAFLALFWAESPPVRPSSIVPRNFLYGGLGRLRARNLVCEEGRHPRRGSILWYDAKRKKEEGSFSKGERSGLWRTWHPNGKLQSEGVVSNGKRTGTWKTWFASGSLEQVASYVDGVPDGPWIVYYLNGNKAEEGRMSEGSASAPGPRTTRTGGRCARAPTRRSPP